MDLMSQTIEQLSIFQNKELAHYRNVDLENLKKDQMYTRRLELSIENLNDKLSKLKSQLAKMKVEQASLKASNDNHVFINAKLSKALKKTMDKLQGKSKQKLPAVADFVVVNQGLDIQAHVDKEDSLETIGADLSVPSAQFPKQEQSFAVFSEDSVRMADLEAMQAQTER